MYPLSSSSPDARRGAVQARHLFAGLASSVALGFAILFGGCKDECQEVECIRGVICVEECGGKVVSSGCCPCPEGTIDSIACEGGTGGGGGSK